ncbi:Zinc finger BED domain-containing protein 1 [Merluccius polli]|uniref:Zinc finger BED domain-containing protein 1 n=1 Tax=Merluccius polli TaxID=89951 RepID=A0AA47NBF1_MERPO|nr:Zinc finger BED domain-containing protein 1 [Merluccius polli]
MTTDSGTNMIKALRLNEWPNLQCFGHKLHNAIVNAVKDPRIDRATVICKKVVSSFSYSWKRRRELAAVQAELGLPVHQLITESPTRWGSRQLMIERVLEQERAIARVLGSEKKSRYLVPTWQDVEVLESVNKAIKPLQDFTDALSGENYVTVSIIKPTLSMFRSSLLKPEDEDTELTKQIKEKILHYMTEKYSDPDKDEGSQVPDNIHRPCQELLSLLPTEPDTAVRVRQEENEVAAAEPGPALKKRRSLSSFFPKKTPASSLSEVDRIRAELATYLLISEISEDADPLQWWKKQEENFPRLSKLARKYLSIPATSAPSERLFSVGGGVVTCHRASLKPDAVDRLVFLAKNLQM